MQGTIKIVRCAGEVGQCKQRIASLDPVGEISLVDTKRHFVRIDRFLELTHQIKIGTSPFKGSRIVIWLLIGESLFFCSLYEGFVVTKCLAE
jgi:hypothetical protein